MGRSWIAIGVICICGGGVSAGIADLPPEWREIARRLSAEDFADRQAAERVLAGQPSEAALPWLLELARGNDPECSLRAIRVLDRWVATAPLELADQAEECLEDLEHELSPNVARQARDSLAIHQELRSQRGVTALLAMGAKVDFAPHKRVLYELYNVRHAVVEPITRKTAIDNQIEPPVSDAELSGAEDETVETVPDPRDVVPKYPQQIYLTGRWTGGDEGVKHLRRLAGPADPIEVFRVVGTSAGMEAVWDAVRQPPINRGPCLGVGQDGRGAIWGRESCHIDKVLSGGAAERAGIQPGDIIIAFGETSIGEFRDLLMTIQNGPGVATERLDEPGGYQPGDEVDVQLIRGGEVRTVTVELGDWTEADTESELWKVKRGFP